MQLSHILTRPALVASYVVILGGTVILLFVTAPARARRRSAGTNAGTTGTATRRRWAGRAAPGERLPAPRPRERVVSDDGVAAASGPDVAARATGATPLAAERQSARFSDLAGVDAAVTELAEVREYLSDPARFRAVGAELPRGILLHGPPGCGKTLLARALAGETGVPFFSASASSFVEQFVGLGAARVRQLFEEAKKAAPSIVFLDELDAVGRHRDGGSGGGREFDHTLNQLLVELDGFTGSSGVLILGATNRPELIDEALLRPGRFDRRIEVERPDRVGREQILRLHSRKRPFSNRVEWAEVAGETAGLTGSELANILNEASLLAARRHRARVAPEDVDEAVARVVSGTTGSRLIRDDERELRAVHEAGHALLTLLLRGMRPPARISIVSRTGAFDRSVWSSGEDREALTKRELIAQLIVLLGGRAAEVATFGEPSTRAEDDLHHAAALARRMVERWAMTGRFELAGRPSDKDKPMPYVEGSAGAGEVRDLVARAEHAAMTILKDNRASLRSIASALAERETLTAAELEDLQVPRGSAHPSPARHPDEVAATPQLLRPLPADPRAQAQ